MSKSPEHEQKKEFKDHIWDIVKLGAIATLAVVGVHALVGGIVPPRHR